MITQTAQGNSNISVISHKCRDFQELATGFMKTAIQYSEYYHSVKAQHFTEVK